VVTGVPNVVDMQSAATGIDGLVVVTVKQATDERGTVRELFRASAYAELLAGLGTWEQVNVTETRRGGVRGLHGEAMTKLVACVAGEAFGAYLDARPGSPTFGVVETVALRPGVQVLVPPGVCNGFQALSDPSCQYLYCFTAEWVPGMAGTAYTPLDPGLAIPWPLPIDPNDRAQISAKDVAAPEFTA
jgi:dTDP-4-dehydrorhamnose 3,5-epimerase